MQASCDFKKQDHLLRDSTSASRGYRTICGFVHPLAIRLLTLVPMLKFRVVLAVGKTT